MCVAKYIVSPEEGLGYLLTDNTTGVYFSDNTKMIMHNNGCVFFEPVPGAEDKDSM